MTATLLRAQGFALPWLGTARAGLLVLGALWTARLAAGIARDRTPVQSAIAVAFALAASGIVVWLWVEMFYLW